MELNVGIGGWMERAGLVLNGETFLAQMSQLRGQPCCNGDKAFQLTESDFQSRLRSPVSTDPIASELRRRHLGVAGCDSATLENSVMRQQRL